MLDYQCAHLRSLPATLRERLRFMVVDDGTPEGPPRMGDPGCRHALYRILVDVRWNWIACRNLAMAEADTEWRLMIDIDHIVPEGTFRRILEGGLRPANAYRFQRREMRDKSRVNPHSNAWLMTGSLYDRIGGYDERLSGLYGTDGDFLRRTRAVARRIVILRAPLLRFSKDDVPDANTATHKRTKEADRAAFERILADRETMPGWRPLRGSFPWERLL